MGVPFREAQLKENNLVRFGRMFRWILALFLSYFMVVQSAIAGRTTIYLHTDALFSIVAASDSGGNILWSKVYEPYGFQGGPDTSGEEFAYAGKPGDETGLSYFGARYYDPHSGRFMGVDPAHVLGNVDHNPLIFNRYAYGNNNPYRYTDPDGRNAISLAFRAGMLVGGAIDAIVYHTVGVALTTILVDQAWNILHNESSDSGQNDEGIKSSFPDRELPRDAHGNPTADPEAEGPYTQLGQREGRSGTYDQGREFDANGDPVRDIDFTDHGRSDHPDPHQHEYLPNSTGGAPRRGPPKALE